MHLMVLIRAALHSFTRSLTSIPPSPSLIPGEPIPVGLCWYSREVPDCSVHRSDSTPESCAAWVGPWLRLLGVPHWIRRCDDGGVWDPDWLLQTCLHHQVQSYLSRYLHEIWQHPQQRHSGWLLPEGQLPAHWLHCAETGLCAFAYRVPHLQDSHILCSFLPRQPGAEHRYENQCSDFHDTYNFKDSQRCLMDV